jgi:sporulation protein YlmC with PRC-barrel domain
MSQRFFFESSPVRASVIIGTNVANPEGDGLGTIKDIVIDPFTFKVAYVVVAFGGFLRTSGKLFAMPFKLFKYDGKKAEYILDLSKEQLEAAPGFDPEHWPSMADEQWHRDVHSYYGYEPWWESVEGVL